MRVEVTFDGEGRYRITYGGQAVAPGPGPLPAPPILFIGSLAACAGVFAVNYLRTRQLDYAGLLVTGDADHAEDPRRLADIRIRVVLPHAIEDRHMTPLQRSVDLCTLKNSLTHPPTVIAEVIAHGRAG